jgi:hypothetical protein
MKVTASASHKYTGSYFEQATLIQMPPQECALCHIATFHAGTIQLLNNAKLARKRACIKHVVRWAYCLGNLSLGTVGSTAAQVEGECCYVSVYAPSAYIMYTSYVIAVYTRRRVEVPKCGHFP